MLGNRCLPIRSLSACNKQMDLNFLPSNSVLPLTMGAQMGGACLHEGGMVILLIIVIIVHFPLCCLWTQFCKLNDVVWLTMATSWCKSLIKAWRIDISHWSLHISHLVHCSSVSKTCTLPLKVTASRAVSF